MSVHISLFGYEREEEYENERIKTFAFDHILLSGNEISILPSRLDRVASFSPAFPYKLNKILLYTWLDKTFCVIIAVKVKYRGNKPTH